MQRKSQATRLHAFAAPALTCAFELRAACCGDVPRTCVVSSALVPLNFSNANLGIWTDTKQPGGGRDRAGRCELASTPSVVRQTKQTHADARGRTRTHPRT